MGKKIQCIGKYVMEGRMLGKGNFARVELATHEKTACKIEMWSLVMHKKCSVNGNYSMGIAESATSPAIYGLFFHQKECLVGIPLCEWIRIGFCNALLILFFCGISEPWYSNGVLVLPELSTYCLIY
ncbi:hypothetical protein KUTeg_016808 [Tegillarca granosa]|uniref:Uncharacterized protein n=1 Tax=Tegillarca granosa TaxID=220873 RepID=A0ABQ9EM08_TEGGR|nr:hypothetical protein KUTeg_016808 [Tegillarca granosa]